MLLIPAGLKKTNISFYYTPIIFFLILIPYILIAFYYIIMAKKKIIFDIKMGKIEINFKGNKNLFFLRDIKKIKYCWSRSQFEHIQLLFWDRKKINISCLSDNFDIIKQKLRELKI